MLQAMLRFDQPRAVRMRAVTQNRRMAASMGIATSRVDALRRSVSAPASPELPAWRCRRSTTSSPNLGQSYIIDSFMVVVFGGVGQSLGHAGRRRLRSASPTSSSNRSPAPCSARSPCSCSSSCSSRNARAACSRSRGGRWRHDAAFCKRNSRRIAARLPLPLAGEGWGGGLSAGAGVWCWQFPRPPRSDERVDLPRKRER